MPHPKHIIIFGTVLTANHATNTDKINCTRKHTLNPTQ